VLCSFFFNSIALLFPSAVHSKGCLGFNSFLGGSTRIFFRIMAGFVLARQWYTWYTYARKGGSDKDTVKIDTRKCCLTSKGRLRNLVISTALIILLMIMPEMLQLSNSLAERSYVDPIEPFGPLNRKILTSGGQEDVEKNILRVGASSTLFPVRFVIDNMGCEACVNSVRTILATACPGIVEVRGLDFSTGVVDLLVRSKMSDDESSPPRDETCLDFAEHDGVIVGLPNCQNHLLFDFLNTDKILRSEGYELHEFGHITKKMKNGRTNSWIGR